MTALKAKTEYEGRGRDCVDAILDGILQLVDEAQAAGCRVDDVGEALIALGDVLIWINGLVTLKDHGRR